MDNLNKIFSKKEASSVNIEEYQKEAKIRHISQIASRSLNLLRIDFSSKFLSPNYQKNITEEYVKELHNKLATLFETDTEKKAIFASHNENFAHFLKTGDIKTPLNLRDEESQFYWGVVLALYASHPEISKLWPSHHHSHDINQSTLWKRIVSSSYMQQELRKHASIVYNAISNPETKIVWGSLGYPNIGYCYIPDKNLIIDDMLWSLVVGADTASPALSHEIAHSQGTQTTKTPRMAEIEISQKQLIAEMTKALQQKDKETYIKKAKEAAKLKLEYQYRFMFFDELENMYANRFAINFGGEYDSAHLNELETNIVVGAKYLSPKSLEEARKELSGSTINSIKHVKNIARNGFYSNNGLITRQKIDDWHTIHLYPELLSGVNKQGEVMHGIEAFEQILEMCDKFEESQPSLRLKNLNAKMYEARMSKMSKKRSEMVDEFFDQFVADYMEELYKQAEQNIDRQGEQGQQQNLPQQGEQGQQQNSPQQGEQGQQQNSPQQGEQGQQQNSSQQGEQGQQQNSPQQGEQGQQQNSSQQGEQGQQQNSPQQGEQGQQQNSSQQGEQGQQQNSSQQGEQGQQQNSSQQGEQSQQSSEMSSSLPTPDQFELPNTDEKYRPNLTKEQIKEMLEKAERLQDLIDSDKENSDKSKQQDSSKNTPKNQEKDSSEDESLENYLPQNERPTLINVDNMKKNLDQSDSARFYREGNYDEYQKYIAQFAKEIAQAKKLIAEIIKQNKLDSIRRGSEQTKQKMTKLPIQGGASIDLKRHVALEQKLKSENPNISRKDLERFRTQYKYRKEELIEEIETPQSNFGILIDGSGSMCGAPFDNALAISCILYEAARSFKEINIYIYMMGSPTPLTIAKPEDKTKTVAKRLESVRKGQGGCNDYLIPAVRRFLLDISEDMAKRPYIKSGFTHIFSITDGGNNDYNSRSANGEYRVNNILETLLDENEQITYDSFFIDEGWINYTKPLIQKMKSKGSTQMDYVDNIVNAEDIPQAITNMLKKRMRHSQIKSPMTNAAKQKIITATLKSIKYH